MGAPGGRFVGDYDVIIDLANRSSKTINSIDTSAQQLESQAGQLEEAIVGFAPQLPDRFRGWKQKLTQISGNLQETKTQLEKIAEAAERLKALGNAGGGAQ